MRALLLLAAALAPAPIAVGMPAARRIELREQVRDVSVLCHGCISFYVKEAMSFLAY